MLEEVSPDASEEWRPVVGYEGLYDVSSLGRVRGVSGRGNQVPGRIKGFVVGNGGYLMVYLSNGPSRKYWYVHRLVIAAFAGPCPDDKEVNHIDAIRCNNKIGNLEYVTRSENWRHADKLGHKPRGIAHWNAKFTDKEILLIRALAKSMSVSALARRYKVNKKTMQRIVKRQTWTHLSGVFVGVWVGSLSFICEPVLPRLIYLSC
jgi:hypothetical protein